MKVLKVLPNESARIAAESSLLVMDVVVQLEDGSIANVEVQKIGYLFREGGPYIGGSATRHIKRAREELGATFSYKNIKKVYTIVLFEKSGSEFRKFSAELYLHRFRQTSDTGVEINLLQEYTFVCLDIFNNIIHNKDKKIENNWKSGWYFLSQDDPDMIMKLLDRNPEISENL